MLVHAGSKPAMRAKATPCCVQWDADNPHVKECAILAVRNLCEGNKAIQGFIAELETQT